MAFSKDNVFAQSTMSEEDRIVDLFLIFRKKLVALRRSKKGLPIAIDDSRQTNIAITAAHNMNSIMKEHAAQYVTGVEPKPTLESHRLNNIIVPTEDSASDKKAVAQIAKLLILEYDMELSQEKRRVWKSTIPNRIESYFAPGKGLIPEVGASCAVGMGSVGIYSAAVGVSVLAALSGPVGIGLLLGMAMLAFCAIQYGKYANLQHKFRQDEQKMDQQMVRMEEAVQELKGDIVKNASPKNFDWSKKEQALSKTYGKSLSKTPIAAKGLMPKRVASLPAKNQEEKLELPLRSASARPRYNSQSTVHRKPRG